MGIQKRGAADPRGACLYPLPLPLGFTLEDVCLSTPVFVCLTVSLTPQNLLCCPLSKLGSAKELMGTVFSRSLSRRGTRPMPEQAGSGAHCLFPHRSWAPKAQGQCD